MKKFIAPSLKGPWKEYGIFAPKDSLTWNSQSTFVLPIIGSKETKYLFMGDRWTFPRQNSAATYVWQPLLVTESGISLPDYKQSWKIDIAKGTWSPSKMNYTEFENTDTKTIQYSGSWSEDNSSKISQSNTKGASFSVDFKGSQVGFYGTSKVDGGYAAIVIKNKKGKRILSSTIDMYCKYTENALRFLSPVLPKGNYNITVTVLGEHGNWYKKDGTQFGSTGDFVALDKIIIKN